MSLMTVRTPQINWAQGFDKHWLGGNPVDTQVFNALSFLFPQGERFFIAAAKDVRDDCVARGLDLPEQLLADIKQFTAQEAIHTRQHELYNQVLTQQGYRNAAERFLRVMIDWSTRHLPVLARLAIVSAYEHYTAILGDYLLTNPQVMQRAHPDLALVWEWHAIEETEHKAVCFDLYQQAGGGWLRRVFWFGMTTLNFAYVFTRNYLSGLRRDGCLKPTRLPRTLWDSARFFFGRHGVNWHLLRYALPYVLPRFHPWQHDNAAAIKAWLLANQAQLRQIG